MIKIKYTFFEAMFLLLILASFYSHAVMADSACLKECANLEKQCDRSADSTANEDGEQCIKWQAEDEKDCTRQTFVGLFSCGLIQDENERKTCINEVKDDDKDCTDEANEQAEECSDRVGKNHDDDGKSCTRESQTCKKSCAVGSGSSKGMAQLADDICPPGTNPNPLGACEYTFQLTGPGEPGKDGCLPGERQGHDDKCYPIIKLKMIPVADGYVINCPKGMKPSPIDGRDCVMNDVGPVEVEGTPGRCRPGTEPNEQGKCVPKIELLDSLASKIFDIAASSTPDIRKEIIEILIEKGYAATTQDVETVRERIIERLGPDWHEVRE